MIAVSYEKESLMLGTLGSRILICDIEYSAKKLASVAKLTKEAPSLQCHTLRQEQVSQFSKVHLLEHLKRTNVIYEFTTYMNL